MLEKKNLDVASKLQEFHQYSQKLSAERLVLGAGGNTSIRIENLMFIKPSGLTFSEMEIDDWVQVDILTGEPKVHPKNHRPSSEIGMHLSLYRHLPEISCIFHAHPPHIIGVTAAHIQIQHLYPDSVTYLGKEIPMIGYCVPCGEDLANATLKNIGSAQIIILENHGAISLGNSPKMAYLRMEVLEELARMHWIAYSCKQDDFPIRSLSDNEIDEISGLGAIKYRQNLMKK